MNRIKIVYLENYSKEWPKIEPSAGNACFDLRAAIYHNVRLYPGEIKLIPLGVKMELPSDHSLKIYPRSGLGIRGLTVVNSPGVIDPSYRGELHAAMINLAEQVSVIEPGYRIVQAELQPVIRTIFHEIEEGGLTVTRRGKNGFGSTGNM